jgi:hypothetical protein
VIHEKCTIDNEIIKDYNPTLAIYYIYLTDVRSPMIGINSLYRTQLNKYVSSYSSGEGASTNLVILCVMRCFILFSLFCKERCD